jgi:MFS family permease
MSAHVEHGADAAQAPISRGQISAAVLGNGLEFYDFTTYALFASQIGRTFFHGHTPFQTLMLSLLTFAVGFVGRPVGAVVIGAIGDRVGRRPAMLLSFALMGLGLVGVVLTPGYARIGAAAPVLLVVFRIIQGFALGGEVGPTTAFLVEAAAPGRRGVVGAWQSASQAIASLLGATVGLVLSTLLTGTQLEHFGWRIAFGLGAIVLPVGFWLRRSLPETLGRPDTDAAEPSEPAGLVSQIRPILVGLGMIMSFTTSTYVLLYMTTFASQTLHMSPAAAFGGSVANGVTGFAFALIGGALSDRFGRKPVMITARCLFLLATFPAFVLIIGYHNAPSLILGVGLLSALSSTSVGVALVALTESLRKGVRSAGLAVIYAVGVSVFGGVAQPSVALLIKATGDPMAPAWYLMAAAAVGIFAMSLMKESRPTAALSVAAG